VNTINGDCFLMKKTKQEAAREISWAVDCEFTRQTYTNEIKIDPSDTSCKIDGNSLKKFQSGGDKLSARKLYVNERSFRVQSKLIMNLNDMPQVTPSDAVQTMLLIKFPFKFVSSEAMMDEQALPFFRQTDEVMKQYLMCADVIDAFTWLVFDAFEDHSVRPCAMVKKDTEAHQEDMGDPLKIFAQSFIAGGKEDYILMPDLEHLGATVGMTKSKAKELVMKLVGAVYDKQIPIKGRGHAPGMRYVKHVQDPHESLGVGGSDPLGD
jgi:hypothetical protein